MVSKTVVRIRFGICMPQTASVVHPVSPEYQITFRTDERTHPGLLNDMLSQEKGNSSKTAAMGFRQQAILKKDPDGLSPIAFVLMMKQNHADR